MKAYHILEIDEEVYLKKELYCVLDEIRILTKKNPSLEENLSHSNEELRKIITNKKNQLKEKEELCEKLEVDVTYLRKELEQIATQLNTKLKFEKSTAILDEILNSQRSPFDKTGLGYTCEGSSSTMQKDEEEPNRYVVVLKDSIKNEEYNKKINYNQQRPAFFHETNESIKTMPIRRSPTNRYQNIFLAKILVIKQ